MNNIPTAEEWVKHFEENAYPGTPISECMIEFAKLHVEAALQAAAETQYSSSKANFELVNEKILNAYPLKNIK